MNNQLQDLLIPPKQAEANSLLWLGLALFICLLGFALWRWNQYHMQPAIIAQKKLRKLLNQSYKTPEESRQVALNVANILCEGLGVKRLDQFETNKNQKWEYFHQRLNTACYSSENKKNNTDITELINEAKQWLSKVNIGDQ